MTRQRSIWEHRLDRLDGHLAALKEDPP